MRRTFVVLHIYQSESSPPVDMAYLRRAEDSFELDIPLEELPTEIKLLDDVRARFNEDTGEYTDWEFLPEEC